MIVLDAKKSLLPILLDVQFICRYGSDVDILSSYGHVLGGSQLFEIYLFSIAVTTKPLVFLCTIKRM